jgi:hypothetical protein
LRIKWSKGNKSFAKAGRLTLYTNSIFNTFTIIVYIAAPFIYKTPREFISILYASAFDAVTMILFAAITIYLSYIGVTTMTNVDKKRAGFWFVIFPAAFYVIIVIIAFIL